MFRTTALRHARTAFPSRPLLRRWNHARLEREAHYGFYDCPPLSPNAILTGVVSIQQPVGRGQIQNPFPEKAQEETEEREQQAEMAARMDEESGRTTGAGRRPTPVGGIIFGSRLAGPAARPAPDPETIRIVEGIRVPPRPSEPDNCCMS
jgi:Oxidoreductase-like protein, N-terminal